jgi:hypothetical protein
MACDYHLKKVFIPTIFGSAGDAYIQNVPFAGIE